MSVAERTAWVWSRVEGQIRLLALGTVHLNGALATSLMEALEPAAWVCTRRAEYSLGTQESGGIVEPALSTALASSLAAQEKDLLRLEPGWDGYGAAPIEPAVVTELVDELRESLKGISKNLPQIIPGGDGSLQAEWYLPGLQVFYQIDEERNKFLFVAAANGDHVYSGDEAETAFPAIVRTLRALDVNDQANGTGAFGPLV